MLHLDDLRWLRKAIIAEPRRESTMRTDGSKKTKPSYGARIRRQRQNKKPATNRPRGGVPRARRPKRRAR